MVRENCKFDDRCEAKLKLLIFLGLVFKANFGCSWLYSSFLKLSKIFLILSHCLFLAGFFAFEGLIKLARRIWGLTVKSTLEALPSNYYWSDIFDRLFYGFNISYFWAFEILSFSRSLVGWLGEFISCEGMSDRKRDITLDAGSYEFRWWLLWMLSSATNVLWCGLCIDDYWKTRLSSGLPSLIKAFGLIDFELNIWAFRALKPLTLSTFWLFSSFCINSDNFRSWNIYFLL